MQANGASSGTGGLVQVQDPDIFPSVSKGVPFMLAMMCMLPILVDVWHNPHPKIFPPALVFCSMCSFMVGYHVHEKVSVDTMSRHASTIMFFNSLSMSVNMSSMVVM